MLDARKLTPRELSWLRKLDDLLQTGHSLRLERKGDLRYALYAPQAEVDAEPIILSYTMTKRMIDEKYLVSLAESGLVVDAIQYVLEGDTRYVLSEDAAQRVHGGKRFWGVFGYFSSSEVKAYFLRLAETPGFDTVQMRRIADQYADVPSGDYVIASYATRGAADTHVTKLRDRCESWEIFEVRAL